MTRVMPRQNNVGYPRRKFRGFEAIHHYWDSSEGLWVAQVLPGDYFVTPHDEVIATTLGSCVATCIRDAEVGVGGLNHFMLPDTPSGATADQAMRYGCYAVERLINELVKHGARRERLEIKIFGGGKVIAGMGDVGGRNVAFARDYFATELLDIAAEDVGGSSARRVRYYPQSGKVLIQRMAMDEANEVLRSESRLKEVLSLRPPGGGVELFD